MKHTTCLPCTNHVVFQANASVQVDAADKFGILVTNGEFTAFVDPIWDSGIVMHTCVEPLLYASLT